MNSKALHIHYSGCQKIVPFSVRFFLLKKRAFSATTYAAIPYSGTFLWKAV